MCGIGAPVLCKRLPGIVAISALILVVHGFHYGIEDECIYLPAVKRLLNPALYSRDPSFFLSQARFTIFPVTMAKVCNLTHLSLEWTFFAVYCLCLFLFVLALRQLAERLFQDEPTRWAAVLLPSALWTMPVAGTALFIMDQHLHPRNMATVLLLYALIAVLDKRWIAASVLVILAAAFHPLVGVYGASLLTMLAFRTFRVHLYGLGLVLPLAWFLGPPATSAWKQAVPDYFLLSHWVWSEWLGVIGPFLCLFGCGRVPAGRTPLISHAIRQMNLFGLFYLLVALAFTFVPRFEPFVSLQPMRSLQLIYLFFFIVAGGILAQAFRRQLPILGLLFLGLCGGMFYAQRQEFPASRHIEWPESGPEGNDWRQAFEWVRRNTPKQAYFVMNARYLEHAGEDFHGFRGLAERGMLADQLEDRPAAAMVPGMASEWWMESEAQSSWDRFSAIQLHGLKRRFGVDWVLLERNRPPSPGGMDCPYENTTIRICRIE
jgi:hypothetical protein